MIMYFAAFAKGLTTSQGPEEICLSLEHQNPSKTSEIMGYFDRVDDRVTVSLHILYTANQETEGSQDRLGIKYGKGGNLYHVTSFDVNRSTW